MRRRILVTGAGGQLGRELSATLAGVGEVVACTRDDLDVADRDSVMQVTARAHPDTVVHAAAWTDVDGCERDPDRAFAVNSVGTRHVVEAARLVGATVCYISTDYVFDGSASHPYDEWHAPAPVSVYGRSKLGGEAEVRAAGTPGHAIVRTSWLCGAHGRNFVKTVLARVSAGETLRVVDDQRGCPTFAADLAETVRLLVAGRRAGLYHVTNQGPTTWYRFAVDIVVAAGLDSGLVAPVSTADLDPPRPARRPANSVLDNAALRLAGLPLLPDHHEPLERLVKELVT